MSPEAAAAIRAGEAADYAAWLRAHLAALHACASDHKPDPRSANYESIDGPDPIYVPRGSREADELADREEARETRWREYDGRRWR